MTLKGLMMATVGSHTLENPETEITWLLVKQTKLATELTSGASYHKNRAETLKK